MNRRGLLSGFLVMVSLVILWGVAGQRGQLADLRAERQRLVDQMAAREGNLGLAWNNSDCEHPFSDRASEPRANAGVTPAAERGHSAHGCRRELGRVRADTERLRARIAARGANGAGGSPLPPGYAREASCMVGYDTPEDALQTLLWATRNHDLTNVLQAFAPGTAEWLRVRAGDSQQSTTLVEFSDLTCF